MSGPPLQQIREQLFATYARQNFWHFGASSMASEIHRRASGLLEARRKSNWKSYRNIIVDLFAWIANFLSGLGVNIEEELAKRYPGRCPYCLQKPCNCDIHNRGARQTIFPLPEFLSNLTLDEWQTLLHEIYPNMGLDAQTATDKIVEEIAEMDTAARDLDFTSCVEEAIDAIARLIAVANLPRGFRLEEALQIQYPNGICYACHQSLCKCTYKQILFSYRPRA